MSQFTEPLCITQLPGGKLWELTKSFDYHVGSEDSDEVITVPAGFRSDGGSVPPFAWPIVGHPLDEFAAAAFVHDWLYQHPDAGAAKKRKRRRCDQIFLEGLIVLEIGWLRRTTMYSLVRSFGWRAWNKYRALEAKAARVLELLHKG